MIKEALSARRIRKNSLPVFGKNNDGQRGAMLSVLVKSNSRTKRGQKVVRCPLNHGQFDGQKEFSRCPLSADNGADNYLYI